MTPKEATKKLLKLDYEYATAQQVEELINQGADINVLDVKNRTALIRASSWGSDNVVQLLLDNKANPNLQDDDGATALTFASYFGYDKVVKLLLDNNADISLKDKEGTALDNAKKRGHTNIVKMLEDYKANKINPTRKTSPKQSSPQATAKLLALDLRNATKQQVETLINQGANINAQDENNHTVLMNSIWHSKKEIVEILIANNADTSLKDNNNKTALDWATFQGNNEIIKMLDEKTAKSQPTPPKQFNQEATEKLLDLNYSTATAHQVEELINQGADINAKDNIGSTALITAVVWNNESAAQLLLDNKANPDLQDKNDNTALIIASYCGHDKIVKLLLDNNADTSLKDGDGTALDNAKKRGHYNIVKMLEEHIAKQSLQVQKTPQQAPQKTPEPKAEVITSKVEQMSPTRAIVEISKMKKGTIETTPEKVCDLLSRTKNEEVIRRLTEYVDNVSKTDKEAYKKYYDDLAKKEINILPVCNFVSKDR